MHKIIQIIFAIFCSNIALSGDFAKKFQPTVSQYEKMEQIKPGSGKTLFSNLLNFMNVWLRTVQNPPLELKRTPYQMDDEDNALLEKVTNLAQ